MGRSLGRCWQPPLRPAPSCCASSSELQFSTLVGRDGRANELGVSVAAVARVAPRSWSARRRGVSRPGRGRRPRTAKSVPVVEP